MLCSKLRCIKVLKSIFFLLHEPGPHREEWIRHGRALHNHTGCSLQRFAFWVSSLLHDHMRCMPKQGVAFSNLHARYVESSLRGQGMMRWEGMQMEPDATRRLGLRVRVTAA